MENITASIIVNTYNRAHFLRRLLPSLTHLRGEAFEVVVVNGPSTDDTLTVLDAYQGQIKVVQCATRNLSQSRNLGIAAAAGEIIVFIDDDALPGDDQWITRYVEAFRADKDRSLGALGGPVWHHDTNWSEFNGGLTTEYGFQKFGNEVDLQNNPPEGRWFKRIAGGNAAYRREALVAIGGFDAFYQYYLEETDVCVRLIQAGYEVEFLPDNAIRHYKETKRVEPINIRWDVITQSDTYFSLKNADDPLWKRLVKTLRYSVQKHYFKELNAFHADHSISTRVWLQLIRRWLAGLWKGIRAGLGHTRSLGDFSTPPPAFQPFADSKAEKPLRIALLSQTLPHQANYGGIGRYVYDLALGLYERGHEVHLFCKDEREIYREKLGFTIHGISQHEQDALDFSSEQPIVNRLVRYSTAVALRLQLLYRQGLEFDVVHGPNWDSEALAVIRAQVYPTVLEVVTSLAKVINTEQLTLDEDLQTCLSIDRWQIAQADVVTVPTRGICLSYEELLGIPHEETQQWQVAPLGIVPTNQPAQPSSSTVKRLLFVGRLEGRKGIHTLLAVLPEILTRFPDWECHLVGNDEVFTNEGFTYKARFLEQHAGADWLKRVLFHGKVSEEELHHYYQTCDLFVAPSLQESFGLIYHEAMQYQKAVVGCQTGGVPEVVEDQVEGLLVPPDCPSALLTALMELMQDEARRLRMGKAGAERIHTRNNYHRMAAAMEKIYQEVIAAVGEERRRTRQEMWKHEAASAGPLIPLSARRTPLNDDGSYRIKVDSSGEELPVIDVAVSADALGAKGFRIAVQQNSDDPISSSLIANNYGFPHHYPMLFDFARPGGRIIDLGTHIGTFSIFAAANGYNLLSVEASPRNAALVKESIRINGFKNIRLVFAAVSDKPGILEFVQEGPYGAVSNPFMSDRLSKVSVQAVTVDSIVEDLGWDHVDLIKMDIEGSEVAGIEGMKQLLSGEAAPPILFESNGYTLWFFNKTPNDLFSSFEALGYTCYYIGNDILVPITSSDLQLECVVDCLAIKKMPKDLKEKWKIVEPFSWNVQIQKIVEACQVTNAVERAYMGRSLEHADPNLLEVSAVITAIKNLKNDTDEIVRNSVSWWNR